ERAEQIAADRADERGIQPQPGGAAGGDRGRAADDELRRVDDLLALPELGYDVAPEQEQIGIAVAHHEQVERHRGLLYEGEQLREPPAALAGEEGVPGRGVHDDRLLPD